MNQDKFYHNQDQNDQEYEEDEQPQLEVINQGRDTYRNKQFDITYNNEDFEQRSKRNNERQEPTSNQYKYEHDEGDDDDEDDNPMNRKLKEMKQQLRNQIQNESDDEEQKQIQHQRSTASMKKPQSPQKQYQEDEEDNQAYDNYRSPEHKFTVQNPIKQEEEKKAAAKVTHGQQLPIGGQGVANFDKVKNTKLFQKFLQKEVGAGATAVVTTAAIGLNIPQQQKQQINPVSSKTSLNANTITPNKGKAQQQNEKRQQWPSGNKKDNKNSNIKTQPKANESQHTHEDMYEQQLKKKAFGEDKYKGQNIINTDPGLDFSIDSKHHNLHQQFLDDSQFYQQNQVHQEQYPPYFHNNKINQENKGYLLDNSELCNEGELIGYSEQIMGRINDMAPGVPNQDEVLCHQPPESFVNMMHEQFNNEMPWLMQNNLHNKALDKSRELPFNNAPQQFDFHKVEPIRQDMQQMREEMKKMTNEYNYLNERFINLKEKYDKLQGDYQKDKNFYEEALEARMNQLEQLENDNDQMNRKFEEAHRRELDLQAQIDQLQFDKEMMQRDMSQNNIQKTVSSKKEDDLYKEIKMLKEQLRDKDQEADRGLGDQSRVKVQLEKANQEVERLRQQLEYLEQDLAMKDSEKQQIQSQVNDLKQRLQHEQTDQHYLRGENEELKNEILMIKQQVNMSNTIQEQLRQQLFEMKDRMTEVEHREFLANSTKDMMQREIQQLRMQLGQANQFIQQQAMFYTQAATTGNLNQQPPPVFQVQPTNWDDLSQRSNYDARSTGSRESAVPIISQKNQPKKTNNPGGEHAYGQSNRDQSHQLKSNNIGSILQWDDQQTSSIPPQRAPIQRQNPNQQHIKRQEEPVEPKIAFPSKSNADPSLSNIPFPSRSQQQPESNVAFPSRTQTKNMPFQEEPNVAFPSRQQKKSVNFGEQQSYDAPPDARNQQKIQQKNMQQSTVMNKVDHDKKVKQVQNIESNLLQLNLERDKYKAEFDKIPENAKTIAQRRRREELERELDILGKNIGSLKAKLRDLEAL